MTFRTSDGNQARFLSPGFLLLSILILAGLFGSDLGYAQPFALPTANRALFEKGGEIHFFVPTTGKPWTSGIFGCVRSDGWQMHEGLDIGPLRRDRRGEATDPVLAAAAGTVAYVNSRSALSNYGKYIILRHAVEGLEVYSLYAHLAEARVGLKQGVRVAAGEAIGVMGRTSNTREGISKERAHVHFELDFFINDRFPAWFKQHRPGERNDHGLWNGQNLIGIDPRLVFLQQRNEGASFSLLRFVQTRPELCRVLVRDVNFPWLRRYPSLIVSNPKLGNQAVVGYEITLDFNGLPIRLMPRTAADLQGTEKYRLLSVNPAEYERNHCRKLVTQHGGKWHLSTQGQNLLELLTY